MACPECGALGVDDTGSCDALFKEVVGWEFSQPELFGVHRLTVDAYCLQHPAQYMKSSKSAAAHLAGMCWSLEYGGGASVSRSLSRWLDGPADLPRVAPPPPHARGSLTVRDVHDLGGAPDHVSRVKEWAQDVWSDWAVGHEQARDWVTAVSGGGPGGGGGGSRI